MKKTFSITIAGIVFHIEEDGYERLRSYLASVQQYFSTYEGSAEIIADIEGRIAEKFSDTLQKEAKQALSAQDVENLVHSMGTVSDFEAIEEEEDLQTLHARQQASGASSAQGQTNTTTTLPPTSAPFSPSRRLFRDTKRKLLGGVCAGLAHYFHSDPLWIRLLFLLCLIGLPIGNGIFNWHDGDFVGSFSGFITVLYLALWVSLPANNELEEDATLKKLYRDPEHKVVGGVVAGVSAYTGWDIGLLRFLFVISILFFGTGILLYLILWAITPEAKTLTDRMEMQGEPITLENIETNVKRNLNVENAPESGLTRLLLFPFRAIAAIFGALGPFVGFLLAAMRIFAGLILVVVGTSMVIGLFVALLAGIGLTGALPIFMGLNTPLYLFADASPWLFVFAFLATGIPFLAVAILGSSLLVKRRLFNARLGLPMLAFWIVGTVGLTALGTSYAANFARSGVVEKTQTFPTAQIAQLALIDNDNDDWNNRAQLRLEGYNGAEMQLEQRFHAQGRNREEAKTNALAQVYNITRKDSTLTFDERTELAENKSFRGQSLEMTLKIPYGKTFHMTESFAHFVHVENISLNNDLFDKNEFDHGMFRFDPDGKLICVNCTVPVEDGEDREEFTDEDTNNDGFQMGRGEYAHSYSNLGNFEKLTIAGGFYVEVKQGDSYRVDADGDRRDMDQLHVRNEGNTLRIDYRDGVRMLGRQHRTVNIRITMPKLKGVEFSGAVKSVVKGFDQPTDLDIDLSGASSATFTSLNAETIEADVVGASSLTLLGSARRLKVDVSGASSLKALNLKALDVDVDATGACKAYVYAVQKLRAAATGASHIGYKGEAKVDESATMGSSVDREEGEGEN